MKKTAAALVVVTILLVGTPAQAAPPSFARCMKRAVALKHDVGQRAFEAQKSFCFMKRTLDHRAYLGE
jgi:hypothetical protein